MSKKIKALFGIITLFSAASLSANTEDSNDLSNDMQEDEVTVCCRFCFKERSIIQATISW